MQVYTHEYILQLSVTETSSTRAGTLETPQQCKQFSRADWVCTSTFIDRGWSHDQSMSVHNWSEYLQSAHYLFDLFSQPPKKPHLPPLIKWSLQRERQRQAVHLTCLANKADTHRKKVQVSSMCRGWGYFVFCWCLTKHYSFTFMSWFDRVPITFQTYKLTTNFWHIITMNIETTLTPSTKAKLTMQKMQRVHVFWCQVDFNGIHEIFILNTESLFLIFWQIPLLILQEATDKALLEKELKRQKWLKHLEEEDLKKEKRMKSQLLRQQVAPPIVTWLFLVI